MSKRILLALFFVIATPTAAAQGRNQAKVTVCHFDSVGAARLLSIASSALKAHLDHGDIAAPPSVKTDADCLVPQPPPEPVAKTATTDANGTASFVIPGTNVIAQIGVTAGGAPVASALTELAVIDDDYFAIAVDATGILGAGFASGKLSEARPGSALRLPISITIPPTNTPPPPPTPYVTSRFIAREFCFTQEELRQFLETSCNSGFSAATSVIVSPVGTAVIKTLFKGSMWVKRKDLCADMARQGAAEAFAGRDLPIRMRVYTPPGSPVMQFYPLYFQDLGSCGGACCKPGAVCELASSDAKCFGRYFPDRPCAPDLCKEGACCIPGAGCSVLAEAECLSRGGRYQGNDTTCSPDPCKKGACCDPRTGCTVLAELECQSRNGQYHGDDTSCDRMTGTQTIKYTLPSGGGAGAATVRIPFTHGTIRSTVTLGVNQGANGQCVRDWRVEFFAYPFNGGRSGGTFYAGQHFGICRTQPETIKFEQMNPGQPCTTYSVNALTGAVAQVVIEVIPP